MNPKVLFLTNSQNDSPQEDELLLAFLRKTFDVRVRHPLDSLPFLDSTQGVIIRNIWPVHEYQQDWDELKELMRQRGLRVFNPLTFKGDVEGKDYLTSLSESDYPVIPSIDTIRDLARLPASDRYWIKPKRSCDGIGAERLSREELLRKRPKGYIIQPFIEFECEPSFFFIDNQFHHAIWAKHRLHDDRVFPCEPTADELTFAGRFVQWADMPYGIQRIDAVRMRDGNLLLTEVENLCPYLYLLEMGNTARASFLEAILASMVTVFSSEPSEDGRREVVVYEEL